MDIDIRKNPGVNRRSKRARLSIIFYRSSLVSRLEFLARTNLCSASKVRDGIENKAKTLEKKNFKNMALYATLRSIEAAFKNYAGKINCTKCFVRSSTSAVGYGAGSPPSITPRLTLSWTIRQRLRAQFP